MTEKRTATHNLAGFKEAMLDKSRRLITGSALKDGAALGCDSEEMVKVTQTMEPKHFYKSMTSHYDAKIWHDVYHVPHNGKVLYVKLTADPNLKLLSFKEK